MPQSETPLADCPPGDVETTLRVVAALRIVCPDINLPATTALETLAPDAGTVSALRAGANVIMPNFTPTRWRESYRIYDNKAQTDLDAAKAAAREAGRTILRDGGLRDTCTRHQRVCDCT